LLAIASLSFALPAAAHISLERAGTHKSRYGDADIKAAPCGKANGARGTNVYTYEPGQTITVKFTEYISHPGYYRFAFDNDGDNDFVTPKSIKPPSPPSTRPCPLPTDPIFNPKGADQCGQSDFYNSPTVLPNMDNLDWHQAGANGKVWTYQVKLPDVECTKCTLQLIQVMEDNGAHGAYTPEPGFMGDTSLNDQYFTCIDIILKRNGSAGTGGASGSGGATGAGGLTGMGGVPGAGGVITTSGGAGGMTTSAGGVPAGMGGTVPGGGGAVTGVGGVTTAPGGTPGGVAGAPAGTGAFFGTGGVDGAPNDDEEGGCAVATNRTSSAGWLAAASALALAWTARRRGRRGV
jgi:hypothetical protein